MSNLKECPFCGSKAKKHKYDVLGEVIRLAYCPNENCHSHHRTTSVTAWNTRPIEDALQTRAEKAEERLSDYIEGVRRVLADEGSADEVHCGCVPILRKRIAELQKDNDDFCSQLSDLTYEKDELFDEALEYKTGRDEARMMVERLIKAGSTWMVNTVGEWREKMKAWDALVAEWKEREE